jgi:hypothetical protein
VSELGHDLLNELELEGSADAYRGKWLDYLARRPDCSSEKLRAIVKTAIGDAIDEKEIVVALNNIRYSGYLKDQETLARKRGRYDELEIPRDADFSRISGLSNEVVQKPGSVRPRTIGQAARIPESHRPRCPSCWLKCLDAKRVFRWCRQNTSPLVRTRGSNRWLGRWSMTPCRQLPVLSARLRSLRFVLRRLGSFPVLA